jgi:hypothetical protein
MTRKQAPMPHHPARPKAIVLGCDPTAKGKDGKNKTFKVVFDIGGDKRYFAGILSNLNALGLDQDSVYVQNLITGYQEAETSSNLQWTKRAKDAIADRRAAFDEIDPERKLPVFLTSHKLYEVLLHRGVPRKTAAELYAAPEIIAPADNALGRMLVPLYRHYKYGYRYQPAFFERVIEMLRTV